MDRVQFAVLHVSKLKTGSGAIGAHIDRKHTPPNASPKLAKENKEYCFFPYGESLNKSIERRIQQGYTSKRKIRKDAVKAVGLILTGSHNRMHELVSNGKLGEWIRENKKWVDEKFGKENILRFTLHMDERTPHIHCVFTPITPDGRLHYKHFIDGKQQMKELHTDYAKKMRGFGLLRGEELTEKKRKFKTVKKWYKQKNKVLDEVMQENNEWREISKVITEDRKKLKADESKLENYDRMKEQKAEAEQSRIEAEQKAKIQMRSKIKVIELSYKANKGDLKAQNELNDIFKRYEANNQNKGLKIAKNSLKSKNRESDMER